MMTLVLDLGNTALKYGVLAAGRLLEHGTLAEPAQLQALWQRTRPAHAMLATVVSEAVAQPWLSALAEVDGLARVLPLRPGFTPVPVRVAYATPHTLGPDRLAAVVGAAHLRPGRPTLVVDAGTALKLELLTADGTYHGGSIAPGLRMRLRALHEFTGRLPLLELSPPAELVQLIGDSTASAIYSGVLNGLAAEVGGLLAQYQARFPGLGVLLTGGDAPWLATRLAPAPGGIFVVPELVLLGLDKILRYNVES